MFFECTEACKVNGMGHREVIRVDNQQLRVAWVAKPLRHGRHLSKS
jgi:hypothetical protein